MFGLVIAGIAAVFLAGFGAKLYGVGKEAGAAECREAIAQKNAELKDAADDLKTEAENHIADMTTAYEQGEKEAGTRVVYVTKKGAADVVKYPVFQNPACVLPAESLRNVNAARAGMRREPPAVSVRDDAGAGASAGAGPAADPGAVHAPVRGTVPAEKGDAGGNVPADAGGRRPLGKLR